MNFDEVRDYLKHKRKHDLRAKHKVELDDYDEDSFKTTLKPKQNRRKAEPYGEEQHNLLHYVKRQSSVRELLEVFD